MRQPIPLLGPTVIERSSNVSSQSTVNFWPRFTKPGAKSPIVLYPTPGQPRFCTAGVGPCRGNGVVFQSKAHFVSGTGFYSITSAGTPLLLGTLNSSAGPVEMKAGRSYIMLVDGTDGYTWNGTTFAQIVDLDFPANTTHVTYLDGYFITQDSTTDEFYISALEDPTSWNALDFEAATAKPDNVLAHASTNRDLYMFGEASIQVYYNSKNRDFPFAAYIGGVLDFGIVAPHSLVEGSSGLFLLATSEEGGIAVVRVVGFQGTIISDDIAWALTDFTTTDDAVGTLYRKGDQSFYHLAFVAENRTFEYIIEANIWVERKSAGVGRHRMRGHTYLGTKNIIGDVSNGEFYLLDVDSFDESGTAVERIRTSQTIHKNGSRLICDEVLLEIEGGVGNTVPPGEDPMIEMRYSEDGGHIWSSWMPASMGKTGETDILYAQWTKLGSAEMYTFEFKTTDPVKVVIINAYANMELTRA